jgi:cytochrome c-type biogenesis protein CcmH
VSFVPYIVAALVALAAMAFVAGPLWRTAESRKAKLLLGGAVALFVLAVGGGVYWRVGEPQLALNQAKGTESRDVGTMARLLIDRIRKNPDDEQSWMFLARIYVTAGDARQAAGALENIIRIARKRGTVPPDYYTAHGELLVQASGNQINDKAVASFRAALQADAANAPARYYLGIAAQQRGDARLAAQYWQSLMDDLPADAPLRAQLVDRMASLGAPTARVMGEGGAPDIHAMVTGLAERLKKNPNEPAGWLRLIRAYSVLGEAGKAKEALATARKTVGMDATVKTALNELAKELKLE